MVLTISWGEGAIVVTSRRYANAPPGTSPL
jgi:hypothetical protein